MATRHIDAVQQKPWTAEDIANQLGRLFYSRREGKAQPKIRIQSVCMTPEAFDNLVINIGGLDILKHAMAQEDLTIHAGSKETFDYINKQLSNESTV